MSRAERVRRGVRREWNWPTIEEIETAWPLNDAQRARFGQQIERRAREIACLLLLECDIERQPIHVPILRLIATLKEAAAWKPEPANDATEADPSLAPDVPGDERPLETSNDGTASIFRSPCGHDLGAGSGRDGGLSAGPLGDERPERLDGHGADGADGSNGIGRYPVGIPPGVLLAIRVNRFLRFVSEWNVRSWSGGRRSDPQDSPGDGARCGGSVPGDPSSVREVAGS
jgi:hypothetical protein